MEFMPESAPLVILTFLVITDASGILQLLIGHESSPFHKKIYFGLTPQSKSASRAEL